MKKEYNFSKGKVRRSPVLKEKETKVQTSIRLDGDIMNWLQAEAAKQGLPYQTFINMSLRHVMSKPSVETRLEALEKKIKAG